MVVRDDSKIGFYSDLSGEKRMSLLMSANTQSLDLSDVQGRIDILQLHPIVLGNLR